MDEKKIIKYMDEYLNYIKNTRESSTFNVYNLELKFWKKYPKIILKENEINEFILKQETGKKISSQKIKILKMFIKWLKNKDNFLVNVNNIGIPTKNRIKKEKEYKNIDVDTLEKIIETIIENTNSKIGILSCFYIYLQYYSGLRIAELFENEVENFNLNNRVNTFKIIGKGKKERTIFVVDRILPFTFKEPYNFVSKFSELFEIIREIKKSNNNKYIWRNTLYKQMLQSANYWCKKKYGSFPHFTSHFFRYSFAYRLIDNNVPIVAVQWFLGHASITTTANYIQFPYADLEYFYVSSEIPMIKSFDLNLYKLQNNFYKKCIFKLIKKIKKYEEIEYPAFIKETQKELGIELEIKNE